MYGRIAMADDFEDTLPWRSRWEQDDAEFVRQAAEWTARCAGRLHELAGWPEGVAIELAQDLSLDDNLRALNPERVAERLLAL